jgi:nucleotide-binding universal stress UspA family protein
MSAKDTTAILNYFSPPPDGSRSYSYINGPDITETSADEPIDLQSRNWRPVRHHVPVHDVRGREDLFDVDKNGFQFFKHITKETDFPDDEEKLQGYYDEAIEAIKQQTSATRVVIFDHVSRTTSFVHTSSILIVPRSERQSDETSLEIQRKTVH